MTQGGRGIASLSKVATLGTRPRFAIPNTCSCQHSLFPKPAIPKTCYPQNLLFPKLPIPKTCYSQKHAISKTCYYQNLLFPKLATLNVYTFEGKAFGGMTFVGKNLRGEKPSWGKTFVGKTLRGEDLPWVLERSRFVRTKVCTFRVSFPNLETLACSY